MVVTIPTHAGLITLAPALAWWAGVWSCIIYVCQLGWAAGSCSVQPWIIYDKVVNQYFGFDFRTECKPKSKGKKQKREEQWQI